MSTRSPRTNSFVIGSKTSEAIKHSPHVSTALKALENKDLGALKDALVAEPLMVSELIIYEVRPSGTLVVAGPMSAFAIKKGWSAALDVLWAHGDRFDQMMEHPNLTVAGFAAGKGRVACLKRMLKLGMDPNTPPGNTPLGVLASYHRFSTHPYFRKAMKVLLDGLADPYAIHGSGKSIAINAVENCNIEAAILMLEHAKGVGQDSPASWAKAWLSSYHDVAHEHEINLLFLQTLLKKGLPLPSPKQLCKKWESISEKGVRVARRPSLEAIIKWRLSLGDCDLKVACRAIGEIGTPEGLGELKATIEAQLMNEKTPLRLRQQGYKARL